MAPTRKSQYVIELGPKQTEHVLHTLLALEKII
jgi:hypothetical protein